LACQNPASLKEHNFQKHNFGSTTTVLTNVVAEHVESRMSNAKQGNGESVVHNNLEYADVQCFTDFRAVFI